MAKVKTKVYPNTALRALALHTQRLDTPNGSEPPPTMDRIYETVEALGCVQIDTLHMVHRAHYVALWRPSAAISGLSELIYRRSTADCTSTGVTPPASSRWRTIATRCGDGAIAAALGVGLATG
jgi:hypothetical protein